MFGFNNGGIDAMIVSSATYADMLIDEFEKYIDRGYNPNNICERVFAEVGCSADDLTNEDYKRVQREVEKMWRKYNA